MARQRFAIELFAPPLVRAEASPRNRSATDLHDRGDEFGIAALPGLRNDVIVPFVSCLGPVEVVARDQVEGAVQNGDAEVTGNGQFQAFQLVEEVSVESAGNGEEECRVIK